MSIHGFNEKICIKKQTINYTSPGCIDKEKETMKINRRALVYFFWGKRAITYYILFVENLTLCARSGQQNKWPNIGCLNKFVSCCLLLLFHCSGDDAQPASQTDRTSLFSSGLQSLPTY